MCVNVDTPRRVCIDLPCDKVRYIGTLLVGCDCAEVSEGGDNCSGRPRPAKIFSIFINDIPMDLKALYYLVIEYMQILVKGRKHSQSS